MRTFLLLIFAGLFATNVSGQFSFSPVDSKLMTRKGNNLTQLICSTSTIIVKFQLKGLVKVLQQNNFVTVNSQTIQIIPLKFSGNKTDTYKQSINDQKQLLDTYSKYELEYFKNELGIEAINPNSRWVVTKSRGFIWYFRIGTIPAGVYKQTRIQLFASTIIGDKILTINAPILDDADFTKAGLIINELMESFKTTKL